MPDFRDYAVDVPKPGQVIGESTRTMGMFLRDVMKLNMDASNFRVMGPDEIASNRFEDIRINPTSYGAVEKHNQITRKYPHITNDFPWFTRS